MTAILALALALLAEGGGKRPMDRIELKNGELVEGYILVEKPDALLVLAKSHERRIPVADIKSSRFAARTLRDVLDRYDKLGKDDAAAQVGLALLCKEQALPGEAEVLALHALCDDAANVDAHTFLGHVQREAGWMVKRSEKQIVFEKLVPPRDDFRDPWEFRTSHYFMRTNLSLRDATTLAIDLERYYREFYRVLGEAVELREVFTPLGVGVYANQREFPENKDSPGLPSYFMPDTEQVLVDAAATEPRRALVHEATHQLFHATTAGSRAGTGQIPGWLDEGFAEYMACSLLGEPGHARFDLGAIPDTHFKVHQAAEKPYKLSRVLQFGSGDFVAGSDFNVKYAQSYTLVHFLMHGAGGKYRPMFFTYLRGAYAGKSTASDFMKALNVSERELEDAWKAHVKNPTR